MARLPFVWSCILLTMLDADVWADTGDASPSPDSSQLAVTPNASTSAASSSDSPRLAAAKDPYAPNSEATLRPESELQKAATPPLVTPTLIQPPLVTPLSIAPLQSEQGPHWAPVLIEPLSLFVVMRGMEAYLWPNPFSLRRTSEWPARYHDALTKPPKFDSHRSFMQWDGDRWEINVIGHGMFGSELYLRPRRCGMGWLGSFAIAAGASTLWEYGIEANGVRPSAVDLVYTPLSGILFGEARFQAWRAADALSNRTWRNLLRIVFDPVGEFDTNVLNSPC